MTYSTYRHCEGAVKAWPKQSGGGVEKVNFPLSFPPPRGNPVLLRITLPCRLRLLMQTNLFNPVIQTVVFTLIPWILDQVEDDKRGGVIIPLPMVIARKPPGQAFYCHSCARGNPVLLR